MNRKSIKTLIILLYFILLPLPDCNCINKKDSSADPIILDKKDSSTDPIILNKKDSSTDPIILNKKDSSTDPIILDEKGSSTNLIILDENIPRNTPNLKRKQDDSDSSQACKKRKTQSKNINLGINNIGNNCYMNALLQQLYDIDDFRDWVLNFEFNSSVKTETYEKIESIKYLFNYISGKENYNLEKIKSHMIKLGHDGYQEDPQECVQLKWLDVFELFKKQKLKTTSFAYNYLFTNPMCVGELNGSPGIFIPKTISNKFILFLNRTLIEDHIYKKDVTPFKYFRCSDSVSKYKMTGSIVHQGDSINFGHYYSYKYNKNTKKWYIYNDSIVKEVSKERVFEDTAINAVAIIFTDINYI